MENGEYLYYTIKMKNGKVFDLSSWGVFSDYNSDMDSPYAYLAENDKLVINQIFEK